MNRVKAPMAVATLMIGVGSTVAEARFLQVDPVGYKDHINLYAYVGNDPINSRDPTGTECVNGADRTTTCRDKGYDVNFRTPAGFQNTRPRASDGHQYDVSNVSPKSATETRQWVRNNPTPGNPRPATAEGTLNNATPRGIPYPSPVVSLTTKNLVTGNQVVVNVTLPGHPLGNGVVIRDVLPNANGTSTIHNFGEGNGFLQSKASPLANEINNVWATPAMRPQEPRPQWDPCASHPGAC
ncbi:MAG TPA: RHS repeat-associated core domain-containing protein [Allosphingosinicella sp.]|jgi:hypothetical protein